MVEIHVDVIDALHALHGNIHKQVIHIEGVAGQIQAAVDQQLGAIDHRVHQDVLALVEPAHLIPADHLFLRQGVGVAHHLFMAGAHLIVYKVAHHQIHFLATVHKITQGAQNLGVGFLVHPVVAVHNLEVTALSVLQSGHYRRAVTAVLLMYRTHNAGVQPFVFIRDGGGIVLGAVVHDQDLHLIAAGEQSIHAMAHIVLRVEAGHCDR